MTSWSTKVSAAAKKVATSSAGRDDEALEAYVIQGHVASADEVLEWFSYRDQTPDGFAIQITDEINIPLDPSDGDLEYPLAVRIIVEKPFGTWSYFFSARGFERSVDDPRLPSHSVIRIAEQFDCFSSRLCTVEPWNESVSTDSIPDRDTAVDPRRIVRDATGSSLPSTIDFWLLERKPDSGSAVFDIWRTQATRALLPVLSSEIWPGDDGPEIVLSGTRKRKLKLGFKVETALAIFADVNEALTWVSESAREAEIRHTLLTKRLATEWPSSDPALGDGLSRTLKSALDGAKSDYKAHLLHSTSETLKALSDLRKALNDEVNKVVERTQALSSALFRDIAIALGAIAIRLVGIADGNGSPVAIVFLGAVAVWLVVSLIISLRFNREILRTQARARASWHRRIHGALAKRDFDLLARKPLKAAVGSYNRSVALVSCIYIVVATLLGAWFAVEIGNLA